MPKIESHSINYTPHHNTLTAGGKSHFSRIADGIAEFVDNSIQATDSQPDERFVHISFFLNRENGTGYVTISDNGVGMNKSTIEQFATYALDRQTRSLGSEDGGSSAIGKFGVGAKQAGFYLGNRLRVITKCKDNRRVMEFVLDAEVFERRFRAKQDVYAGEINVRDVGDYSLVSDEESAEEEMQLILREHEDSNENFTIVVIRMHRDMVKQMLTDDRYNVLPNELAEIYHYHLHPKHCPKEIIKMPKFVNSGGRLVECCTGV
jgi:structural maintenance of chromosomes flexible hinge domain-containing protein 1